jgi:23S rRNA maturation-related 3'-5' exoribonuclease YhaM
MAKKEELDNKKFVVDKLLETKREGMEDLIAYMEDCEFFSAPCSGSYHLACEFGLVQHTRNVMMTAENIGYHLLGPKKYPEIKDSVTIAAALHDLGKMGQFEKPNYIPNILKGGKQSDSKPFTTNPDLLYVDHEIRSIAIASMFIDLTEDEQFAILYHNGMYGNLKYALNGKETPLFMIIHWADMWASRVIEEKKEEK